MTALTPGANARPAAAQSRSARYEPFVLYAEAPEPGTEPMHLYLRRSNRHKDDGDAIPRQLDNARRKWNAESGFTILGAFIDNDSASKSSRVQRRGWAMLEQAIADGEVQHVGFDRLDRTYRFTRKQLEWVESCQQNGVQLHSLKDPAVIFEDTPTGHLVLSVSASLAQGESMLMSSRQLDSKRHAAESGFNHGGMRPFGWISDPSGRSVDPVTGRSGVRLVPHPVEFPALKDAIDMALRGDTFRAISLHWADRYEITTATGRPVYETSVRRALVSPRLMGYRMRQVPEYERGTSVNLLDYVVRDEKGEPIVAHEAACDRLTWQRLQHRLADRKSTRTPWGKNEWELTGLVRCATCGGTLSGVEKPYKRVDGSVRKVLVYRCLANRRRGAGTCSAGVTVRAEALRSLVLGFLTGYVTDSRLAQAREEERSRADDSPGVKALDDARAELAELKTQQGSGKYKGAMVGVLLGMIADAQARVSELEAQTPETPALDLAVTSADELIKNWGPGGSWTLTERRHALAQVIERIEVSPGKGPVKERAKVTPRF